MASQQLMTITVNMAGKPGVIFESSKTWQELAIGPQVNLGLNVKAALTKALGLINFPYQPSSDEALKSMIDKIQLFGINGNITFQISQPFQYDIDSMLTSELVTAINIWASPRNLGPRSGFIAPPIQRFVPSASNGLRSARLVYVNRRTGEVADPQQFVPSARLPLPYPPQFIPSYPASSLSSLPTPVDQFLAPLYPQQQRYIPGVPALPGWGLPAALPVSYSASPFIGQKLVHVAGVTMSTGLNTPFNVAVSGLPVVGVVSRPSNGALEIARHIGREGIYGDSMYPGFRMFGGDDQEEQDGGGFISNIAASIKSIFSDKPAADKTNIPGMLDVKDDKAVDVPVIKTASGSEPAVARKRVLVLTPEDESSRAKI